jgi:hypothetical protein
MPLEPYIATERRQSAKAREILNLPFNRSRSNVHSQNGEDGIIRYLLDRLPPIPQWFIEFGAWDGRHLSNCAALAEQGWSGLFIEADPDKHTLLTANYAGLPRVQCHNAKVASAGASSLDSLVQSCGLPLEVGLLSIDIDGNDYHVWRGTELVRASIVLIEFNQTIPADVVYVQPDDPQEAFGSSLAALTDLAAEKGYRLAAATEWNAFFVLETLCESAELRTYYPEDVKTPEFELRLFYGTNGRCVTTGLRNLIWHNVPFAKDALQILPPDLIAHPEGQTPAYYEALVARRAQLKGKDREHPPVATSYRPKGSPL